MAALPPNVAEDDEDHKRVSKRNRQDVTEQHTLKTVPPHAKRYEGKPTFSWDCTSKSRWQQRACSTGCKAQIRTYCLCNPYKWICQACHVKHVVAVVAVTDDELCFVSPAHRTVHTNKQHNNTTSHTSTTTSMAALPPDEADARALDDPDLASIKTSRSSKRLKLGELYRAEMEHGEHEGLRATCAGGVGGGGGVSGIGDGGEVAPPAWFAPFAAQLANIGIQVTNIERRQRNAMVEDSRDQLMPIQNAAGNPAPTSPLDVQSFLNMNDNQIVAFLGHYGLPAHGNNTVKSQRIKRFMGFP